ncbi:phosphoribosylamine--glycine ligase [Candidatus Woesearchaeota archaeon]|nr:phosphoribosylamine--glycine ligase [Candidatus Woesearchaeota archaeon]
MEKIILVGNGARENAIADALIKGGAEIYAYMQLLNPGIRKSAKKYEIGKLDDSSAIVKFAKENEVKLAVIGPEAPLAAGVVDALEKEGIGCVGPTKALAQLETSKSFTRELLKKHNIDVSPKFGVFMEAKGIAEFLEELGTYVIKPDGLTGGKGVKVFGEHIMSHDEGLKYCEEVLETHPRVVIEEKLEGEEFSLQSLTDGESFLHFPPVQDHKRAFDGDKGPNTGGMGSYSDADLLLPFLEDEDVREAEKVTERVAAAIKKDYRPYRGVMYGGFIKTAKGVKLIEYNARLGDPEAMNVLPLLKTNFTEVCKAVAEGKLGKIDAEFERKATVCKYVVPEGYPDSPKAGRIEVPTYEKGGIKALVYYAAVDEKEDGIYMTKSRGVAFVGMGRSLQEAEKIAEQAAEKVKGGVFHRKDIGTENLISKRIEHIRKITGGKNERK